MQFSNYENSNDANNAVVPWSLYTCIIYIHLLDLEDHHNALNNHKVCKNHTTKCVSIRILLILALGPEFIQLCCCSHWSHLLQSMSPEPEPEPVQSLAQLVKCHWFKKTPKAKIVKDKNVIRHSTGPPTPWCPPSFWLNDLTMFS